MASMYISEYSHMGHDGGNIGGGALAQLPQEPSAATQKVTFTTTVASAAFNAETRIICVRLDASGHVSFGNSSVAATTSHKPLTAGTDYYFGVKPGDYIAAVTA